jgi:hypothetical protein
MAVEGFWDVGACSNVRWTWPLALGSQRAGDQWYRHWAWVVGVVVVGARRLGLRAAAEGVRAASRSHAGCGLGRVLKFNRYCSRVLQRSVLYCVLWWYGGETKD